MSENFLENSKFYYDDHFYYIKLSVCIKVKVIKVNVGENVLYYKYVLYVWLRSEGGEGRHIIVIYVFLSTQLLVLYYQIYSPR